MSSDTESRRNVCLTCANPTPGAGSVASPIRVEPIVTARRSFAGASIRSEPLPGSSDKSLYHYEDRRATLRRHESEGPAKGVTSLRRSKLRAHMRVTSDGHELECRASGGRTTSHPSPKATELPLGLYTIVRQHREALWLAFGKVSALWKSAPFVLQFTKPTIQFFSFFRQSFAA